MGKLDTFQQFLSQGTIEVDPLSIITALILAAIFSFILSKLYVKYGEAVSNRVSFSKNFVPLTVTTTLIIFIVKSSLALSLGLVGALSIVRFRAAIKEPEELVFLFLSIAIGLGFGAGQIAVTVYSFIVIAGLIYARHFYYKDSEFQEMNLTISGKGLALRDITEIVKKYSLKAKLRRFDSSENGELEAIYSVGLNSFNELEKIKEEIEKLSPSVNITYLDQVEI